MIILQTIVLIILQTIALIIIQAIIMNILQILQSDNPKQIYIDYKTIDLSVQQKQILEQQIKTQIDQQFKSNEEIKSLVFMAFFQQELKEKGPVVIFKEFKKSNVIISPETAIFKTIRYIPFSLIENALNKLNK